MQLKRFTQTASNQYYSLAQADVGIAVGSGSDIATETASIILVNSNPKDIAGIKFVIFTSLPLP